MILIQDVWKYTPIVSNGVNFVKDYKKDSYDKIIFIENNVDDMNILTTFKKTLMFF